MFGHKWRSASLFGVQGRRDFQFNDGEKQWRDLHMVKNGGLDNRKYSIGGDPLQREDKLRHMEGWTAHQRAQELEDAYNAAKETLLGGTERPDVRNGAANEFGRIAAQKVVAGVEQKLDEDFLTGFTNWLRGAGTPQEYEAGQMPGYEAKHPNRPISQHPEVLRYLERHEERKANYYNKLAKMMLNQGRTGPKGSDMSMDQAWKYYKYVVKGMPFSGQDLKFDDGEDPAPPEDAIAKAQNEANVKPHKPHADSSLKPADDDKKARPHNVRENNMAQTVPPHKTTSLEESNERFERKLEEIRARTEAAKKAKEEELPKAPPSAEAPKEIKEAAVQLVSTVQELVKAEVAKVVVAPQQPPPTTKQPAKSKIARIPLERPLQARSETPAPLPPDEPEPLPMAITPRGPPTPRQPTPRAATPRYNPDAPYPDFSEFDPELKRQKEEQQQAIEMFRERMHVLEQHFGPASTLEQAQLYHQAAATGQFPQFAAPSQPQIPSFAPPPQVVSPPVQPAPQPILPEPAPVHIPTPTPPIAKPAPEPLPIPVPPTVPAAAVEPEQLEPVRPLPEKIARALEEDETPQAPPPVKKAAPKDIRGGTSYYIKGLGAADIPAGTPVTVESVASALKLHPDVVEAYDPMLPRAAAKPRGIFGAESDPTFTEEMEKQMAEVAAKPAPQKVVTAIPPRKPFGVEQAEKRAAEEARVQAMPLKPMAPLSPQEVAQARREEAQLTKKPAVKSLDRVIDTIVEKAPRLAEKLQSRGRPSALVAPIKSHVRELAEAQFNEDMRRFAEEDRKQQEERRRKLFDERQARAEARLTDEALKVERKLDIPTSLQTLQKANARQAQLEAAIEEDEARHQQKMASVASTPRGPAREIKLRPTNALREEQERKGPIVKRQKSPARALTVPQMQQHTKKPSAATQPRNNLGQFVA